MGREGKDDINNVKIKREIIINKAANMEYDWADYEIILQRKYYEGEKEEDYKRNNGIMEGI